MGDDSFFFFPVPGFLSGVNSVFDPAGVVGSLIPPVSDEDSDSMAAFADWRAVAGDLTVAAGIAMDVRPSKSSQENRSSESSNT